ncbi:MAG: ribonuclease R [Crocinitomicaceae bacterium]|nr:ribonuclease R [Crocinitomicaceae bacterium]
MPKKKTKKNKNKQTKSFLRKDILSILDLNPNKPLNYKQIASYLKIKDKAIRTQLSITLSELVKEETLIEVQRGKYKLNQSKDYLEGTIDINVRGTGYVHVEGYDTDFIVKPKNLNNALNGDRVKVYLQRSGKNKVEAVVKEVLERRTNQFVGVLEVSQKHAFLIPNDANTNVDIYIPLSKLKKGRDGQTALVKITDWPSDAKSPFGEVVEVLESSDSLDTEAVSILTRLGLNYVFPEDVQAEAQRINFELDKEEISKRRDFREITTLTIDPVDAKDFDDALSIEFLDEGIFRVGVHIADVSHYVPIDSALDKEALLRGNSVYMVDRVVPMLPEHLSNGVCSLRPNEEKFSFSAVFDLNEKGKIIDEWFGKTVILSDKRFAYEDAQKIIETKEGDFKKEILTLDKIAKNLRKKRLSEGALEIASSEIRFELDEAGKPTTVYKKTTKDANKLIEEFMLLANKRVGTFLGNIQKTKKTPGVYRVHDKPDSEKVGQFATFISKFGENFTYQDDRDISTQMNKIFKKFKDDGEFDMIQSMAIKSMAKAVYDTTNIGHYGLGFEYYSHFTSPIRRYADLLVHRILFDALNDKYKAYPKLTAISKHISLTERKATEAERTSKKYFQTLYLQDKVGEVFEGIITGLTDFGIFVEIIENFCEGMVSLRDMKGDRYFFDEDAYEVYGQQYGDTYRIGQKVNIKILKVNPTRKQIDFILLD